LLTRFDPARISIPSPSPINPRRSYAMQIDLVTLQPLVALIFGILILIIPRLLNYLIAIYLIVVGLVGLWPQFFATTTTI
jgi:Protein of unknown function (DUF3096)